jgi:hypothetical protein
MEVHLRLAKIWSYIHSGRFKDDKLHIMFAYLNQYAPVADFQLSRIEDEINSIRKLEPTKIISSMEKIFADVRYFYELMYWIGLAVEKAARANHTKNPQSAFFELYKRDLKIITDNLKMNRIILSHIHFDQLINYEFNGDPAFEKHLPKNGMLFQIEILKDEKGILIGDTKLIPRQDINQLDNLLSALQPRFVED